MDLAEEDTDIFLPGLFDRYASRPKEDNFETMTLAHFAVWYDTVPRVDNVQHSKEVGRQSQPRYKLQDNMGWIRLRTKQACLRTPLMTPQSHGDEYYYGLLLLYIPWRQEKLDLLQQYKSAMTAFIAREKEMKVLNSDHHAFAEEVQRAVQQLQAVSDNAYMDLVAPNAQHGERQDESCPIEEMDAGLCNAEHYVADEQLLDQDIAATLVQDDDANGAMSQK